MVSTPNNFNRFMTTSVVEREKQKRRAETASRCMHGRTKHQPAEPRGGRTRPQNTEAAVSTKNRRPQQRRQRLNLNGRDRATAQHRWRWAAQPLAVAAVRSPPAAATLSHLARATSRDALAGPAASSAPRLLSRSLGPLCRRPPSESTLHASFYPHPTHGGGRHVASEPRGPADQRLNEPCASYGKRENPFPFSPRRPFPSGPKRPGCRCVGPEAPSTTSLSPGRPGPTTTPAGGPRTTRAGHPDMWTRLSGPHPS